MFVPFFAVPLAASWIAAADGTPKLDVTQSCRAAAAGYVDQTTERLKSCLDSEQRTREWVAKGKTVEDLLKEFGRI